MGGSISPLISGIAVTTAAGVAALVGAGAIEIADLASALKRAREVSGNAISLEHTDIIGLSGALATSERIRSGAAKFARDHAAMVMARLVSKRVPARL